MVLLIKWENIDSPNNTEISKNKTYQNRNTFTYKNKNDFKKECRPNTQTFNKTRVATITSNSVNTDNQQKNEQGHTPWRHARKSIIIIRPDKKVGFNVDLVLDSICRPSI